MAKLSRAAQEEIAAAVKILREDGVHIHKTYAQFQETLKTAPKAGSDPEPELDDGGAPPKKDPPPEPDPKPEGRRLWW